MTVDEALVEARARLGRSRLEIGQEPPLPTPNPTRAEPRQSGAVADAGLRGALTPPPPPPCIPPT
eukprot:CAMPEP_0182894298 /NCGR_PEP_ID=MMETSP0034_2-20130328/24995_1 /TAXON_ID=156128 /ORGANISM="Nephroselmis pyriformis, Strain CCMP717" /LENGTH=64 /DNA_ID=CAMNT_0025028077 /DNA_START=77 /DNA_END=268 /DNA_ORIENTATION=-